MNPRAREQITLVEVLELTAPFEASSEIIEAATRRLETEGVSTLLGAAKPIDVRVYGKLGEDAHAWLRTMNVVSKVFENPVAGFVR